MLFNHYSPKATQTKNVWQLKKGDQIVCDGTTRIVDRLLNYNIGPHDVYTLIFTDGTKIKDISDWTYFEVNEPLDK